MSKIPLLNAGLTVLLGAIFFYFFFVVGVQPEPSVNLRLAFLGSFGLVFTLVGLLQYDVYKLKTTNEQ